MGLFEVLVIGYAALFGTSICGMSLYSFLYERKKKKLGYVNKRRSMLVNSLLSMTREDTGPFLLALIPLVNLTLCVPLLMFKKASDEDLEGEISKDDVMTVDWARILLTRNKDKDPKLALRVLKARKAQMRYEKHLNRKNRKYDKTVLELESTYRDLDLPEKVVAVRKLQNKSNAITRVTPFSEYTADERIAMLLAELDYAYQEKAKKEGTDVEKEVKLLLEGERIKPKR